MNQPNQKQQPEKTPGKIPFPSMEEQKAYWDRKEQEWATEPTEFCPISNEEATSERQPSAETMKFIAEKISEARKEFDGTASSEPQEWRKIGACSIDVGHKKCPQCYDAGSRDLLFDAHNAAIVAAFKRGRLEGVFASPDEGEINYVQDLEQQLAAERERTKQAQEAGRKYEAYMRGKIEPLVEALQMLHDDIADYARINNLGGFQNHAMKLARAALAKAKCTCDTHKTCQIHNPLTDNVAKEGK
jgi:hypothetical protein